MNAQINLDRSFFTVVWGDEVDTYTAKTGDEWSAEARVRFIDTYHQTHKFVPFKVFESNPTEGWCNDITADFETADDLPDDASEYAAWANEQTSLRNWHNGRAL